jgi:hypothetical protein
MRALNQGDFEKSRQFLRGDRSICHRMMAGAAKNRALGIFLIRRKGSVCFSPAGGCGWEVLMYEDIR